MSSPSGMLFYAISGQPIKNGSAASFSYGRIVKKQNLYTDINLDTNIINNKYSERFDGDLDLYLWSNLSQQFIPPTPSITPSNTPTASLTPSNTPTITNTSSNTPTLSPTITNTTTQTPTNTPTPTSSLPNLSITPTNTPTNTATSTTTNTPSPTPTITTTPTVTITPTATSTPTTTSTPTPSAVVIAINTNSANFNSCAGTVSSVGTNGRSSYYGTYDQSGNIWEWTETVVGSSRVFRGGNWGYDNNYLSASYRNYGSATTRSEYIGFRIASYDLLSIYPNMVLVTDINNAYDITGFGSVNYTYYISKYEITNNEYIEFLNSVAQTDTYSLYVNNMNFISSGGITRTGSVGGYTYTVKNNMGNKPVNFVNWANCARYCNWLHNGKPSGNQDSTTTENGSYNMSLSIPTRTNNATIFIPNENEWYKAAYYKGGSINAGYWLFATQSDITPNCVSITSTGDGIPV